MGMDPVRAICQTCNGTSVRRVWHAALDSRFPGRMLETSSLKACDVCDARGTLPMPGRPIVGSLRGLLDGPGPDRLGT